MTNPQSAVRTPAPAAQKASFLGALAVLFLVSGALALVYEILWQRQFALLLGSSSSASAAVLAAFFGGLGLGSYVLGPVAERYSRPLKLYASLELTIGLGALLALPIQNAFSLAYPFLYQRLGPWPWLFFIVKFFVAACSILLPAFCMGGTLPVLARLAVRSAGTFGTNVALLYFANTLGAALGSIAVAFWLLRVLGAWQTLWAAVVGNVMLAFAAWMLDKHLHPVAAEEPLQAFDDARKYRLAHPLKLSFISGFAVLAFQVLWNRAFSQVHENSLYSFAVIVGIFILALAAGAQAARAALRRSVAPRNLAGCAWACAGILLFLGPWLFLGRTQGLSYLPSDNWSSYMVRLTGLGLLVLLLPVTFLGIGLPAIMAWAEQERTQSSSRTLGRVLAVNVMGSILGALAAGFVLPSFLGLWNSILLLAALLVLAGAWALPRPGVLRWLGLLLLLAALLAGRFASLPRARLGSAERLLDVSEGSHGVVAVVEKSGSRRLKLNNYYVLGGTSSTGDERMQAHLPLLLHPSPKKVAVLGLGTGITASGALFHPAETITAIELVPEVVRAARKHFSQANANFAADNRVKIVLEDARNFLRGTPERFDVIIGDLVVPWRQGEGALFTQEQFSAARNALAPGGIYCQWLPLFQLSKEEFDIVVSTFLSVFPSATLWRGDFSPDQPALALVGSSDASALNPSVVRQRLGQMRPDPANPQLAGPLAVWMYYVGHISRQTAPGARINSEERPWIELLGPLAHSGRRKEALFVGRKLQQWMNGVAEAQARSPLVPLDADEIAGQKAGAALYEFTLCLSEGNRAGAGAAQQQLQHWLPARLYNALMGQ